MRYAIEGVTSAHLQWEGARAVLWQWHFVSERVEPLHYLSAATPTTVMSPSTYILKIAVIGRQCMCACFFDRELRLTDTFAPNSSHDCQQLSALCRLWTSGGWECIVAPFFSTAHFRSSEIVPPWLVIGSPFLCLPVTINLINLHYHVSIRARFESCHDLVLHACSWPSILTTRYNIEFVWHPMASQSTVLPKQISILWMCLSCSQTACFPRC